MKNRTVKMLVRTVDGQVIEANVVAAGTITDIVVFIDDVKVMKKVGE